MRVRISPKRLQGEIFMSDTKIYKGKIRELFACELVKKISNSGDDPLELTQKEKENICIAIAMWNAFELVLDDSLGISKK